MADFSQIKRQEVIMPTARHTFYEFEGEPWVEVKPATERNKPFLQFPSQAPAPGQTHPSRRER